MSGIDEREGTLHQWDWVKAAKMAGAGQAGRFNCGTIEIRNPRAVLWQANDGRRVEISGDDLRLLSERIADVLAYLGVGRNDRVAGVMSRRPEALATPMATWRLGAIYVPLFSSFGTEALRVRLQDSGTKVVVCDATNAPKLEVLQATEHSLKVLEVGGSSVPWAESFDELAARKRGVAAVAETLATDPATIMYTSGTSGQPKGCVIPHKGVITIWPYVYSCLALSGDDLLFSTADPGWAFGLYTTGFGPLSLGHRRLLFEPNYDPDAWWQALLEWNVNHLASAPTAFRQLSAAWKEKSRPETLSLRTATSAGEPLNPEVIAWFHNYLSVDIYDSYGLTELGMVIANPRRPPIGVAPGSMGIPVPGFEVKLVDDSGESAAIGESGRIAVKDNGYLLSSTYWGKDDLWQARMQDGWWVTEDLARQDASGRFWYVARADDVIVSSGYNIGPSEVENVLLEHPAVSEAACVGEDDPVKGQVVVAYVVLFGPGQADLTSELRQWVGQKVGWHAAPRRVYVCSEIPRTETGKIRRGALRPTKAGIRGIQDHSI